ncbi:MAG TPA: hypothetical protein VGQ68_08775, partial [Gaiellaceae bacterium]|nr:hypothetical protein [Gaiellaceae bacterium]
MLSVATERAWAQPGIRAVSTAADPIAAERFTLQIPIGALPGDVVVAALDLRLPGSVQVTA